MTNTKNIGLLIAAFLFVALAVPQAMAYIVVANNTVSSITNATATVSWTTNGTSHNNTVYYSTVAGVNTTNFQARVNTTQNSTTPALNLTSLNDRTTYYYMIYACDNQTTQTCNTSVSSSFTTTGNCGSNRAVIDCDFLDGMPHMGEDLGSFLVNIAPGIGIFILILSLFGGIAAIVAAVSVLIKKMFSGGNGGMER